MRISAIILALLTLTGLGSPHADWNTGVGGLSARYGYMEAYGPLAPDILWQGSRPAIVSTQAACDGDLLVVSRIQSFTIPTGTWLVAHDLHTGEELWAEQLPYDFPGTSWRSRISAIRGAHVYASRSGNTADDYLYALDREDGSIVWRSEHLIGEETTESLAFAPNGDLIVGNYNSVMRIDHADGTTVWEEPRSTPSSNGAQASVFGNRVYLWEASAYGPTVTALDIDTGTRLFSSDGIGGGYVQQLGLLCGPDGTVYAPRTQNNPGTDFFVALADTGMGFEEKWRVPMGYTPFASCGVGPDGSVYTYSRDIEILRLDPDTGTEIDRSMILPYDFPAEPRMAIDADGNLYVSNGGFSSGEIFAFTADLELIWSESIYGINLGGPTLADDGTLVVCGTGTRVRAYRRPQADVAGGLPGSGPLLLLPNAPNPFAQSTEIRFALEEGGRIALRILDAEGRLVRTLLDAGRRTPGEHRVRWDGRTDRGTDAPSGLYMAVLSAGQHRELRKMILSR